MQLDHSKQPQAVKPTATQLLRLTNRIRTQELLLIYMQNNELAASSSLGLYK
jgi:hypothetical protein